MLSVERLVMEWVTASNITQLYILTISFVLLTSQPNTLYTLSHTHICRFELVLVGRTHAVLWWAIAERQINLNERASEQTEPKQNEQNLLNSLYVPMFTPNCSKSMKRNTDMAAMTVWNTIFFVVFGGFFSLGWIFKSFVVVFIWIAINGCGRSWF